MFPLLDDPKAVTALRAMFGAQLDVAAEFGLSFLLSGLDYRASPDWGEKLGYSAQALADANFAAIEFLREVSDSYRDQIPRLLIGGILGLLRAAQRLEDRARPTTVSTLRTHRTRNEQRSVASSTL